MNITLNNNKETLDGDIFTIAEIIKIKDYKFKMLVVRINGELVKKDRYETATVKDGDDVKIIHLVSGG